ncbi:hypothetical protein [Kurthia zopfii]|uniref:hypothetical protein n=1 Tax=Kurthia zopfii TaxID=1650 RepID=UPI000F81D3C2|nr:hypothetical protein [Kurthia zopfii]
MKNGEKKHSFTNSFILKMLNNKRKKGELCYIINATMSMYKRTHLKMYTFGFFSSILIMR